MGQGREEATVVRLPTDICGCGCGCGATREMVARWQGTDFVEPTNPTYMITDLGRAQLEKDEYDDDDDYYYFAPSAKGCAAAIIVVAVVVSLFWYGVYEVFKAVFS